MARLFISLRKFYVLFLYYYPLAVLLALLCSFIVWSTMQPPSVESAPSFFSPLEHEPVWLKDSPRVMRGRYRAVLSQIPPFYD